MLLGSGSDLMINPLLLDDLTDFLTGIFNGYIVEDEKGTQWAMTVIKGFLPPKRTEPTEDYEKYCIVVRYADGEADWNAGEDQAKSTNRINIIVRTWSDDVQLGPQNTINLMAMIQREIYSNPILVNKYRAVFPLKWKAPDGQSFPIWQGEMTIPYIVPMVQEIFAGGMYNE
jgi:hypothetical protein